MVRFINEYKRIHKLDKLKSSEETAVLFYFDIVVKGIMEHYNIHNYGMLLNKISELNHSIMASSVDKDIFFTTYLPLAQAKNEKYIKKNFAKSNYKYYVRNICKVFFNSPKMENIIRDNYFED